MLPEAHLALMDEIGKANSIVRNSALGLMNEREFLNGKIKLQSPLITMIGCSNELLDGEEDGAFWDRLSLRYMVDYLQRFALKPKPRKILKALRSNAFKISLVVRLIGNCCR